MVRLIVLGLLFASPASLPALAVQATDWDATWDELEGLLAAPEAEGVPAARERLVGVAQRATPDPRGRLLAAWLERSAGGAGALELEPAELDALTSRELWLAARVLAPGPALDRALIHSLAHSSDEALGACFQAAFERFTALSADFEEPAALALGQALHMRAQAWWSAMNLSTALRRAGRYEEAYELLSLQMRRAPDGHERGALHQERALVDQGAGWEARARDDLGAALTHGSVDAAAVLGRRALAEGRLERARVVFRSVLRERPQQSWALRGWGLSMLPRQRERL